MAEPVLTWKEVPTRFAVHMLIGILMFVLVGLGAVVLHLFVNWLKRHELPKGMIISVTGLEYGIFSIDVILFSIYLVRTGYHHGRLLVSTKVD